MKIYITSIELWAYRISIIGLIIFSILLSQGNRQAQYMGLKNADMISENQKQITKLTESELVTTIIQQAMAEDYPPKKHLKDREWCKNESYLPDSYK